MPSPPGGDRLRSSARVISGNLPRTDRWAGTARVWVPGSDHGGRRVAPGARRSGIFAGQGPSRVGRAEALRLYPRPRLIPFLPGRRSCSEPRAQGSGHWVQTPRARDSLLLAGSSRGPLAPEAPAASGRFPCGAGPLLPRRFIPRGAPGGRDSPRAHPEPDPSRGTGLEAREAPGALPRP